MHKCIIHIAHILDQAAFVLLTLNNAGWKPKTASESQHSYHKGVAPGHSVQLIMPCHLTREGSKSWEERLPNTDPR